MNPKAFVVCMALLCAGAGQAIGTSFDPQRAHADIYPQETVALRRCIRTLDRNVQILDQRIKALEKTVANLNGQKAEPKTKEAAAVQKSNPTDWKQPAFSNAGPPVGKTDGVRIPGTYKIRTGPPGSGEYDD